MSSKPMLRRVASQSPARETRKSVSPPPQTRGTTAVSTKPSVMQFQSKGARSEMELNFDRYCSLEKTAQPDQVTGRGLVQLLTDAGVAPKSVEAYVVLWRLGATQLDCITRSEWLLAMYRHGVESVAQFRLKVTEWVSTTRDNAGNFLLMYNFLYDYIRGEEDRLMSVANASNAWELLFSKNSRYEKWKKWLTEHVPQDISRDLWRQLGILFLMSTDLTAADPDTQSATSFPSIITDFLEDNAKAR